jgi:hypothetical protein
LNEVIVARISTYSALHSAVPKVSSFREEDTPRILHGGRVRAPDAQGVTERVGALGELDRARAGVGNVGDPPPDAAREMLRLMVAVGSVSVAAPSGATDRAAAPAAARLTAIILTLVFRPRRPKEPACARDPRQRNGVIMDRTTADGAAS